MNSSYFYYNGLFPIRCFLQRENELPKVLDRVNIVMRSGRNCVRAFRYHTLASVDARLRDEGIRNDVSVVVGGSVRSAADVVKAIALGADACYIATSALLALGCHLCRSCNTGKCNWGIATQRADLVKRLNPDIGYQRLIISVAPLFAAAQ